jgi:DNA-binding CsgD family transcriptional regulator
VDGWLYFGGINGFNSFVPHDIKINPFIPPIVWTALYWDNRKADLGRSLSSLKDLVLPYKADFVTFEFAALCYANPAMNQFAYRLEGRDDDWLYVGPNRAISLANLSHEEYTLRVKGANPDGVWNEEGLSIDIKIIPPFWRTRWFVFILLIVLAAMGFFVFRWRKGIQSIQLDYEKNLEKIFEKYKITPREQEIIDLIIKGASNKDIEKKLFISDSTVRNHIYNIYQKLDVQNRIELINFIRRPRT